MLTLYSLILWDRMDTFMLQIRNRIPQENLLIYYALRFQVPTQMISQIYPNLFINEMIL